MLPVCTWCDYWFDTFLEWTSLSSKKFSTKSAFHNLILFKFFNLFGQDKQSYCVDNSKKFIQSIWLRFEHDEESWFKIRVSLDRLSQQLIALPFAGFPQTHITKTAYSIKDTKYKAVEFKNLIKAWKLAKLPVKFKLFHTSFHASFHIPFCGAL